MNMAAVIATIAVAFLYAEVAIGTGYYMLLITKRTDTDDEQQKKQLKKYSIIAGIFFPITFAILIAGYAAGRKNK